MATATNPKTFTYHVFKNGAYQGDITRLVIGDFKYQQEINSSGSTITITLASLADSYSEGTVVDFNNQVVIYEIDDANPNGVLIFQGLIINYQPVFADNNQEQVILTVMGYGSTLNDYVLESAETTDVNQNSQNNQQILLQGQDQKFGGFYSGIESFKVGAGVTKLSAVEFWLSALSSLDLGTTALCQVFSAQSDAEGSGLASLIASASLPLTSSAGSAYKFTFATAVTVVSGNTYWARISLSSGTSSGIGNGVMYSDSTAPYPDGTYEQLHFDGSSSTYTKAVQTGDAYIKTYQSAGNTQFSYNSQDPSAILRSVLDNYIAQGGKLTYTAASIDSTNTTVTYTFNSNTIFDAMTKVLSLAPVGWYFYIDQANNVVHFHKVSSTATHKLTLGKNIKNLAVEKRAQDLVNVVYFVGGPTGGVNLYNKYILQTSIDLYGRHAIVYSDNNVTLSATAQIISNNILSTQGQVELRIGLDIMDDGGNASAALGFDIESITLGESISFRSFGPGSGGTLWDVAKWDLAKWDFDITDISSVIVQVTRIDYTPDVLSLTLSTVPPDITKRVQDIYRNLQQANVLLNPATPS